jgi:hypothetical protein
VRACLSSSSSSRVFMCSAPCGSKDLRSHASRRSSRMARVSSTAPSRYSRCATPLGALHRCSGHSPYEPLPSPPIERACWGGGRKRALHVSPAAAAAAQQTRWLCRPAQRPTVRRPRSCAAKSSLRRTGSRARPWKLWLKLSSPTCPRHSTSRTRGAPPLPNH